MIPGHSMDLVKRIVSLHSSWHGIHRNVSINNQETYLCLTLILNVCPTRVMFAKHIYKPQKTQFSLEKQREKNLT